MVFFSLGGGEGIGEGEVLISANLTARPGKSSCDTCWLMYDPLTCSADVVEAKVNNIYISTAGEQTGKNIRKLKDRFAFESLVHS